MKKEENKIVDFFDRKKTETKKKNKERTVVTINKNTKATKMVKKKTVAIPKIKKTPGKKGFFKKSDSKKRKEKKVKTLKANTLRTKKRQNKASAGGAMNRLVNGLILILVFIIPFFVINQTFQGIDFEKNAFFVAVVSILVLLVALGFLNRHEIKIRKTFLDKYILALLLFLLASVWFSVDRWHSLVGFIGNPTKGLMTSLALIVTFYIIVTNFTTKIIQKAFWVMIFAISLLSVYTLIAGLGLIPAKVQVLIPLSLTGSLSGVTTVLASGIPLLSVALIVVNNNSKKFTFIKELLLFIALVFVVLTLVMLYNFVFWSGVLVGVVVVTFLLLGYKRTGQKNTFLRGVIFSLFAIVIVIAGLAKSNYQTFIPVLAKVGLPIEIKVGLPISVDIIRGSVTAGLQQGLIGSGPATFGYDFAKFHSQKAVAPILESRYIYQGDGLFGEAVPTIGIIGSVLFLLIIILWLIKGFKSLHINKQTKIYLIGLFSSSVIWLSGALFSQLDAGTILFGSLLLMITTGLILENNKERKEYYQIKLNKFTIKNLGGVAFLLIVIVVAIFGLAYISKAYLADVYMRQAMMEKTVDKRPAKMLRSVKLVPQEGMYYTKLGQTYLILAQEKNNQKDGDKNEVKKTVGQALRYIRKATMLMPNDVRSQRVLADTYVVLGNYDLAEKTYKKIINLEPNNVQYYVALGDLQLLKINKGVGNKDEMIKKVVGFYQKALTVNPYTDVIYYKLATLYMENNNIDNALKNIAMATKLKPRDDIYRFTLGVVLQKKGGEKELVSAEKIFKSLLLVNDKSIDVIAQLGLLYEQEGKIDEAKQQYQRVIDIIGDDEKYQAISKTMKKFIENLNNGQSNIPEVLGKSEQKDNKQKTSKEDKEASGDQSISEEVLMDNQPTNSQDGKSKKVIVTITVDEEGPINVRSEGSLRGKKLTKIKTTGDFQKIGEKGKWIQIIIPAQGGQEQITGWVHSKFVTAEK